LPITPLHEPTGKKMAITAKSPAPRRRTVISLVAFRGGHGFALAHLA